MRRLEAGASLLTLLAVVSTGWPSEAWAIPTITRDKIISIAKSGVGSRYVWGGTCWNPNDRTWKGPDCSGYVTKCWQIPSTSKTTDCVPHYYTTLTFTNSTTHWTKISRSSLVRGDALVYRANGAGHIVLYESGDKWGSAQVYEARGTAYGVVHRTKYVESKYVARRRKSIVAPKPTYPLMTIDSSMVTVSGQTRDYCKLGDSSGVFDWKVGQKTKINIDVKNSGTEVASDVRVTIWAEQPYLKVRRWNIYSDWKNSSFKLNDTDGMQSIGHDNPAKSFTLKLASLSVGETKRIVLTVEAMKFSVGAADHPDLRAWISKVASYYEKSSFSAKPNNVDGYQKQNGGDLRTYNETDVFGVEVCDGKDNDCDGDIDEGVCGDPTPEPTPTADIGAAPGDAGATGDTATQPDGGASFEASVPVEAGVPVDPNAASPSPAALRGQCGLAPGVPLGFPSLGVLLVLALALLRRRRGGAGAS